MAASESAGAVDAAAAGFVALAPELLDSLGRVLVEHTDPHPGERVLDACCGESWPGGVSVLARQVAAEAMAREWR
jgi:hypothetical protein